ncbi:GNAT family N-acetyltransferase [uncultured Amnibacterium sp.]|uniref:GNAT family N-acetyltransferase n=1 Tax=uncultured Amnibacterium sp. TaxID=1631851 RepID=UPI0035CB3E90
MTIAYHRAPAAQLDPVLLYRLLELRVAVFVVEQRAAYDDLDGRDVEPGAELLWAEEDGVVLGTARVLHDRDPEAMRIGRVATAVAGRSRGVASALMRLGVERCQEVAPRLPILLDAQEHLAGWYARFGFVVDGEQYLEDGIPHVPMRLDPAGLSAPAGLRPARSA